MYGSAVSLLCVDETIKVKEKAKIGKSRAAAGSQAHSERLIVLLCPACASLQSFSTLRALRTNFLGKVFRIQRYLFKNYILKLLPI